MPANAKGFTPHELAAFGVGLGVTVLSAVLLPPITPLVNFAISAALGGTAGYGMLKVLDPLTEADKIQKQVEYDFSGALREIEEIGRSIAVASKRPCLGEEVGQRLAGIVQKVELLLQRHRERPRDLVAASTSLQLLKSFRKILDDYVKVKCGEVYLDKGEAERLLRRTEGRTIPMFDRALEELLRKMDRGQATSTETRAGTLEDMLRSLDLIRSLGDEADGEAEEAGDDKQE